MILIFNIYINKCNLVLTAYQPTSLKLTFNKTLYKILSRNYIKNKLNNNKENEKNKLISLLKANKEYIAGVRNGIQQYKKLTETYNDTFLKDQDSVVKQTIRLYHENLDEITTGNTILNSKGKPCQLTKDAWRECNLKLHELNISETEKGFGMLTVSESLQEEMKKHFTTYLQYQTFMTSLIKIIPGDSSSNLTKIFSTAYANLFYGQQSNVKYIKLSNLIGNMLINAFMNNFINVVIKKNLIEVEEYLKLLYSLDFFDDEKFLNLNKDLGKQEIIIDAFLKLFGLEIYRFNFSLLDLINLIEIISLQILVDFHNKVLEMDRKKIINSNSSIFTQFYAKILEKTYTYKHEEDLKISRFFRHSTEKYYMLLGHDMIQVLEDKVICVSSLYQEHKKTEFEIKLINENFYGQLQGEIPSVYFDAFMKENTVIENKIMRNRDKDDRLTINYQQKKHRTVHNNNYIVGFMRDKKNFDTLTESNKFTINTEFTYKFFTEFLNIKQAIRNVHLGDNIIIENDIKNIEHVLGFAGQLYEINFIEIYKNAPTIFMKNKILVECIHGLDFNNFKKIKNDELTFETHLREYYDLFKSMINQIYSKKIVLNGIFSQIYIMCHFGYFHYNWFSDSRGRKQMTSLLSLQGMPIIRCFVGFCIQPTIEEMVTYMFEYQNPKDYSKNKITKMLKNDVNTTLENKLKTLLNVNVLDNNYDFWHCCTKSEPGKGFLAIALLPDYINFKESPLDAEYRHVLGLDSTNSGMQMQSIMLKNKNLASKCNLLFNSIDAYLVMQEKIRKEDLEIREFMQQLKYPVAEFNNTNAKQYFKELKIPLADILLEKQTDMEKFTLLENYELLVSIMSSKKIYEILTSRSVFKILVMTTPYGSTMIGAIKQIREKFISEGLKQGIWFTNQDLKKTRSVMPLLYKRFKNYFKKEFPEALIVLAAVKLFFKSPEGRKGLTVKSKYFSFTSSPVKYIKTRISIGSVKSRKKMRHVLETPTNEFDVEKSIRATPANIIQFADATIVSLLVERICNYNNCKVGPLVMFYSNHDCFYMGIVPAAFRLRNDLKACYRQLYNMNLLENFKSYPIYYKFIKEYLNNKPTFSLNDLCNNSDFVK